MRAVRRLAKKKYKGLLSAKLYYLCELVDRVDHEAKISANEQDRKKLEEASKVLTARIVDQLTVDIEQEKRDAQKA